MLFYFTGELMTVTHILLWSVREDVTYTVTVCCTCSVHVNIAEV